MERRQNPQQMAEGAICRSETKATWPVICSQRSLGSREQGPFQQCWTEISRGKAVIVQSRKARQWKQEGGSPGSPSDTPMQVKLGIDICIDQLTALFSLNGGFRILIWYRPGSFNPNKWYPHPMPTTYHPAKGHMRSLQHNLVSVPD